MTKFTLPKRPRIFESFAGVGMQRMALDRLGIEYECVGFSEIDRFAIQSYQAIHGDTPNYGDITKIKGEDLPPIDIFTYSFPCQDLSVAGKQRGINENTRSGLVYEVLRILNELDELDNKPKMLIMENVAALVHKKFIKQFEAIKQELSDLGYTNHVQTLNAKDYGVAQNRNRVFMVSILGDYEYEFPKTMPLQKRLKDYLEREVDEKYYLSDKMLNYVTNNSKAMEEKGNGHRFKPRTDEDVALALRTKPGSRMDDNFLTQPFCHVVGNTHPSGRGMNGNVFEGDMAPTLTTNKGEGIKFIEPRDTTEPNRIGGIYDDENSRHQAGAIWDKEACGPTLDTMQGGNRQPMIIVPEATKQGFAIAHEGDSINLDQPNSKTRRDRVGDGMANTLTTGCNQAVVEPRIDVVGRVMPPSGKIHQNQEVYNPNGLSPTLKATNYKDPIKSYVEPICLNPKVNGKQPSLQDRIYDSEGISTAVTTGWMPNITEPSLKYVGSVGQKKWLEDGKDLSRNARQGDRIYDAEGLAASLSATGVGSKGGFSGLYQVPDEPNVLSPKRTEFGKEVRKDYEDGKIQLSRHEMTEMTPRNDGISNTLTTVQKDNLIVEPVICASRGRNPNNPSDRTVGSPTEQRLEINPRGTSNALTTVQKDNLVLEPSGMYTNCSDEFNRGSLPGVSRCLKANNHDSGVTDGLRIRKLTPLECWRLMGIDDECFYKAQASGVSNSQLYKQAGNGLVVDVFAYILSTMVGEEEKEEWMTVQELIEFLSWCDSDKIVKVAKGEKRRDIVRTDEDDDCVVLVAS